MTLRSSFKSLTRSAFVAGVLAVATCAPSLASEDVDIFGGKPGTGALPNILIVLDSSSNWNATLGANACNSGNTASDTKFAAEVCALQTVIPELPSGMRLGIMMFVESGDNGAYVRFAARELTDQNKKAMVNMLSEWVANGSGTDNSGSNQPMGKAMFEAFKYFGGAGTGILPQGQTGFGPIAFAGGKANNSGSYRRDYVGNTQVSSPPKPTDNRAAPYYGADANSAFLSFASNEYQPPATESCTKNFIIFIGNGNPSVGGDASTNPATAAEVFKNIGGNPSDRILSGGVEEHPSLMDEFARHFNKKIDLLPGVEGQQKILTYTMAVYQPQKYDPVTGKETVSNTDQQLIKLMQSAAIAGGGEYFAARNAKDIIDALRKILNDVQAVNSVFVSASLPVSVNTQGTFLNQVYMGLFRPEPKPRWMGNVKQYKFIQDSSTGDIYLADANGVRAVNQATGFTSPAAVSFWTQDSTFWSNDEKGIPPSKSDMPDGDVVEKGGTAYVQRREILEKQAGRRLYTCVGCGSTPVAFLNSANAFDTTNITGPTMESEFGVANAAELELLVDWIRGEDNAIGAKLSPFDIGKRPCNNAIDAGCSWKSAEAGPGWPTTVRPSLQGDVLHSRPVVLNYDPDVGGHAVKGPYMFYGSNDGFLRAVKGGQDPATDGVEVWSFIAPEFFGKFRRLRLNDPPWLNPGTDPLLVPVAKTKDYFFDGPIGSWEDTSVKPHKKWIFVGARRGGRVLYAFDVTNPEDPILKWKKTGGPSGDLKMMGQTWSLPIAFKLLAGVADPSTVDPYLVFGAGYDTGEDEDPVADNAVGRGIYVLNANTGAELAFITHGSLTRPIASDMAFLAKPAVSGFGDVYRGYVGDLGGNVWRLDIDGTDATKWQLFHFASLGSKLKFMYAPDLVKAGDRDFVLLGSGDREKPLVKDSEDFFFGLADHDNELTPLGAAPALIEAFALTEVSGEAVITDPPCATCKGWFRRMVVGEKVVNSPLTVAGVTYFATNRPVDTPPGACQTNLGEAKAYGVGFLSGGKPISRDSVAVVLTGGGLPPSPVGGVVELEPGKLVTFVIGSGKDGSRLEPERPPLNVPTTRRKIYWNTKTDLK